jgi:malate dehydrogenase (oxaloacetate-decarboxylating)(NADP+)
LADDEDLTGFKILGRASLNKGTVFSLEERKKYKLRGLLPPRVVSPELQLERALMNMRRKGDDIAKYIFLTALQARNERLFYQLVIQHIQEIMPLIYTPTVGQACKEYAHLFRRPRGMYITSDDRGEVKDVLENWPYKDIRVIVVTDGERILGLGDLGTNGIGIPIGKLALYVACAGIQPAQCLPVMLDVGTNNRGYLDDPLYLGLNQERLTGDEYLDFADEFIQGVKKVFPRALIQFEDFLTPNAYALLNKYRDNTFCFNDDIQGTAGVALAGVYASIRLSNKNFKELKIMFLGAGSAATGIADLICYALEQEGLTREEARLRLWFVDVDGLVESTREGMMSHNQSYMHNHSSMGFVDAINDIKPDVLIGATGAPSTFTPEVIQSMCEHNERPVIFALSNPTTRAECTAEDAYKYSKGKAIFSSGSPFAKVEYNGKTYEPGQGNNVYIFPGIGLGTIVSQATKITDDLLLLAAKALAEEVTDEDLKRESIYPPLTRIRDVSFKIAMVVADYVYENNLARTQRPDDLEASLRNYMYDPSY